MSKWSLTLLVILTASIIATLILVSQLSIWTATAPLLSIVLGWLLKTINESVTVNQQHKWELEKIAQERTLKYYEAKLSEMSSFAVDELNRLVSSRWSLEDKSKFTKEWVEWSSSARTFAEVIEDTEIVTAYTEVATQSSKWLNFVGEYNAGKFSAYNEEQMQLKAQEEMGLYMSKLKKFQTAIERARLNVLRGEIVLKQNKTG